MQMTPKRLQLIRDTQKALQEGEQTTEDITQGDAEECWKIPVTWICWGMYKVPKSEAQTLEEAIAYVGDKPLPDQGEYVDDSIGIDREGISVFNDLDSRIRLRGALPWATGEETASAGESENLSVRPISNG